jgi:hypothetical protein
VKLESAAEAREENKEEANAEVLTSVEIDKALFSESLKIFLKKVQSGDRKFLSTALSSASWKLENNKWVIFVENEVSKKVVDEEKWILPEMRSLSQVPSLILEVRIKESNQKEKSDAPLTNTQRLEKMKEKNPALNDFIQRFDTMLGY